MSEPFPISPTVRWEDGAVVFLDQTKLPEREVDLRCRKLEELEEAIRLLRIRGAPAIGIAAAFGVAMHVWNRPGVSGNDLTAAAEEAASRLANTRPTGANLFWALDRIKIKADTIRLK